MKSEFFGEKFGDTKERSYLCRRKLFFSRSMNTAIKESFLHLVTSKELADECISVEESRKQILEMVHDHYHKA